MRLFTVIGKEISIHLPERIQMKGQTQIPKNTLV